MLGLSRWRFTQGGCPQWPHDQRSLRSLPGWRSWRVLQYYGNMHRYDWIWRWPNVKNTLNLGSNVDCGWKICSNHAWVGIYLNLRKHYNWSSWLNNWYNTRLWRYFLISFNECLTLQLVVSDNKQVLPEAFIFSHVGICFPHARNSNFLFFFGVLIFIAH